MVARISPKILHMYMYIPDKSTYTFELNSLNLLVYLYFI